MKKITRAFKQAKIIVRLVLLTFLMHSSYCDIWYDASRCCQEPIDRSCNYPIFLPRRFHRPIYSYCLNLSRIQIPTGTSVTNCNHKHGLMLTCRHVHVRPHCFILTEACSCRLELAYFAGKISKNRLVCKNAVALAYYGSCRLLVMGSCSKTTPKLMHS